MTIEALLEEQNDLLKQLLAKFTLPLPAEDKTTTTKGNATKPVAEKTTDTQTVGITKTVGEDPAAESLSEDVKPIVYDDVKNAVTALVKAKGRDIGLGVLASFKVASATELKENQWPAVIEACKAAL